MAQKRVIYATQSFAIASEGTTAFTAVHGCQTLGMNTNFAIENIYEIGKLAIYANIEGLPEVEISAEKVLDGHPLMYHLATSGATDATLIGRSAKRCNAINSIYVDTQNAASGTPVAQVYFSGLYVGSIGYSFTTQGPFKENISFVGNNKVWRLNTDNPSGTPYTVTGGFTPTDAPLAVEGVNYRPHFDLTQTLLPKEIPGVNDTTGVVNEVTGDLYNLVLQTVNVSTNLNRDEILQLGKLGPYFRFASFPTEVTCEIGILSREGDNIDCDESATSNTTDQAIFIRTTEGTEIDLGIYCRLRGVQVSGGDAGQSGSNQVITYNYFTQNDMTVAHPADPTVALRP